MCGHVLDAGYAVTLSTRTRERAGPLLEQGAAWADSPAEVAAASDVVLSIVGYPSDVREVVLGEAGVLRGARDGIIVVDMTTSEPALAVEIHAAGKALGVEAIDAPVSGGDVGARNATPSFMVGGDEKAVERVRPLLETMGQSIVRQGGPGAGPNTKKGNTVQNRTRSDGPTRRPPLAPTRPRASPRWKRGKSMGTALRFLDAFSTECTWSS